MNKLNYQTLQNHNINKAELRKEFAQVLRDGITFSGQVGDYLINESVFEWIENRIGRQSNAPTKEELKQKFFRECYDEYHDDHQALFIFDWLYSQLQERDRQLLLAIEFGFKQCEKGNNLDAAFIAFKSK